MQEAYIIRLNERISSLEKENKELKSQLKLYIENGTKTKVAGAKKQLN